MQISCCWLYAISKYGYPVSVPDIMRALGEMADLGFQYVELEGGVQQDNLLQVYAHRLEIKKRCGELGLKVVNFCPILPDLVSLNEAKRNKAYELFDLALELALFFGCETIQVNSYAPPLKFIGEAPYEEMISYGQQYRVIVDPDFNWNEQWAVLVESMRHCTLQAKGAGLRFCLEPRVGELISNTDGLLRLMDAISDDNFGAVLDTGHLHAQKEILPLSVEKLGKRIFYLHVSDNDGKVNEHLGLGRGTIDWEGVFTALKKHHFDGYVAIDVGGVPDLDEQYRESKAFLERLAQKLGL